MIIRKDEKTHVDDVSKGIRYMVRVALFSAIAFIVIYLEFPIGGLFPSYLKLDFSEVIVFIGGMVLGPGAIIFIELIKNLLNLMLKSSTGGVGELANFVVGVGFLFPVVYLLKTNRSMIHLIKAFTVGVIIMTIVAVVGNYFVFLPLYGVTDSLVKKDMIIPILLPFNIFKGVVIAIASITIHQSIKGIYKHLY